MISRRTMLANLATSAALTASGSTNAQTMAGRPALANLNASAEAGALYQYLVSIYGEKTLTGQQESIWQSDGPRHELNHIHKVTGKEPALLGLDYIDPNDWKALNDRATAWYQRGGIPTICWHWGNPLIGPGYEQSKKPFNAQKALIDPTSSEAKAMWRDLKAVGDQLETLRDRKVPVLWRPFHEFTGDWFWWGKQGPEIFKALWLVMFAYYVRQRKLDNLIWVLGYTRNVDPAWNPGEAYYDILSADNYVETHEPQKQMWTDLKGLSSAKPIAMQENGPIPDPDLMTKAGTPWLFFLTWHSKFIMDGKVNDDAFLKRVYNDERFLTLDELPGWGAQT